EQKSRFVPPLARGEHLGAFALTEAEAGSDAGAIRTKAEPADGGWTITGAKQWITNGRYAGTFLLFARTDQHTAGARGVSAFILDADHVRVTRDEEKLGLNSSVTNDIVVESAHVDRDRLLHEENRGFRVAMTTLDGGRIGIAAQALGIAQAAYDVAREYALQRHAFGHRIADFQAIQQKLADMSMEIDAARLLIYRAAWLRQQGRPHTEEGAKAKLFASEMARRQAGDGSRVPKLDCRIGAFGAVDELNSALGVVLTAADLPAVLRPALERIQNDLFDVGADLSVPYGVSDRLRVEQDAVDRLEALCDEFNADLSDLRSFVLPGGTEAAARLHVARATCRRAERDALVAEAETGVNPLVLAYLNRLS